MDESSPMVIWSAVCASIHRQVFCRLGADSFLLPNARNSSVFASPSDRTRSSHSIAVVVALSVLPITPWNLGGYFVMLVQACLPGWMPDVSRRSVPPLLLCHLMQI